MAHDYLLIIDTAPVDSDLQFYFAQFNIDIIWTNNLNSLPANQKLPIALLIDYSILKNNPDYINKLYAQYPIPILIISAERDEDFCIRLLEAGADDFLIKPLYPREVHARINAISRRVLHVPIKHESKKEVLSFTHWRIYPSSRQIFDEHNNELFLSAGEYELLLIFIEHPQKILTREFLLQLTKNSDFNPFDRRIDIQISRLRQKIESDAKRPELIKTIRNGGYLFTAMVTTQEL